jgi:glutamine amidotransferase PdxT
MIFVFLEDKLIGTMAAESPQGVLRLAGAADLVLSHQRDAQFLEDTVEATTEAVSTVMGTCAGHIFCRKVATGCALSNA